MLAKEFRQEELIAQKEHQSDLIAQIKYILIAQKEHNIKLLKKSTFNCSKNI